MDREHTCCVTGHRDIPVEKVPYVQDHLYQEQFNMGTHISSAALRLE